MKKVLLYFTLIFVLAISIMAMMSSVALAADGSDEGAAVSDSTAVDEIVAEDYPVISFDTAAAINTFMAMVILAVIIETIAEWVKAGIAPIVLKKWAWLCITSAVGIGVCLLFGVDIFKAAGFSGGAAAVVVGKVLTGVGVGAGSSFVHIWESKMNAVKSSGNVLTAISNTNNDTSSGAGVNSAG